jgi:hypothetical protein
LGVRQELHPALGKRAHALRPSNVEEFKIMVIWAVMKQPAGPPEIRDYDFDRVKCAPGDGQPSRAEVRIALQSKSWPRRVSENVDQFPEWGRFKRTRGPAAL